MVGVIEMAAAPREEEEEEEGEDFPRLNMFHIKLLFTSASKCTITLYIYGSYMCSSIVLYKCNFGTFAEK